MQRECVMPTIKNLKDNCSRPFTLVSLLFLITFLSAFVVVAQDNNPVNDPYPLRPADTSSPRHTLRSFNSNINQAFKVWDEGQPPVVFLGPVSRAKETLDLSQLPGRGRQAKEIEAILFLKEILDRIELPPQEEIPGDQEIAINEKTITSWTIPNTRITIAKVAEGPRTGEFLFTSETVESLGEFYKRVMHLPYKPGALVGLYEDYILSPGPLVPRTWAIMLPVWSKKIVLGEAIWQWLVLTLIIVLGATILVPVLYWGHQWDEQHANAQPLMQFGAPLGLLAGVLYLYGSRLVLFQGANFSGDSWIILSYVIWALIFIGLGWFIILITSLIANAINESRHLKEGTVDAHLMRIVLRLVSLFLIILLAIYSADFYGVPLTPLLASLGIGGIAIALAVRPTLENIIGGLTLFADRPVRAGDYCRYGDKIGMVENIGLRSTRVRAGDRTLVTIPNAEFSQMQLENFGQRDKMLYRFMLCLRYETTPDQIRFVLAKVREMLLGHPRVENKRLRVRFRAFGVYSLNIEVYAFVSTRDRSEYMGIQEDMNLRIIDIVAEAGTGFAFPSQTTYLRRDTGLSSEQSREAELHTQELRSQGRLPFPEFDDSARGEMEDILDYPQEGSYGYEPRTEPAEAPTEPELVPNAKPKRTGRRLALGRKKR
jgi:MscS family membrane protein